MFIQLTWNMTSFEVPLCSSNFFHQ